MNCFEMEIDKKIIIKLVQVLEDLKKSLISGVVTGGIFGLGDNGYILAIIAMQNMLKNENK